MNKKRWPMKPVICLALGCALVLSACVSNKTRAERFVAGNRENLSRLELGMTRAQLVQLMGVESVVNLSNPARSESFMGADGKPVEVIYYCVSRKCRREGETPIVIADGRVTGWGRGFLESQPYRAAPSKGFHITVDRNTNSTVRTETVTPPAPAPDSSPKSP